MIKKILLICFVVLFSSSVYAGNVTLNWDDVGASGYTIEQSVDNGVTWTEILDAGNVLTANVTAPDNVLVLFRFAAYNSVGKTYRYDVGVWHNSSWTPAPPPVGVGVQ